MRLKTLLLRWNHLLLVIVAILPFFLLLIFGLIWLYERDQLAVFILGCLIISILGWLSIKLSRHRNKLRQPENQNEEPLDVEANPEWSDSEKRAFFQACRSIQQKTENVLAWQDLPPLALDVIQEVAVEIGGDRRKPLDFSAPEALLLIEQAASRYREQLRSKLPFADQISIASMHWIWQRRKGLSTAWKLADGGRRLTRFATNPTYALLKEIEQLVTDGNSSYLSEQMLSTLQMILLEEVASAAVDLYSGRLKFSDSELLKIELESTQEDKKRIVEPDAPLRILVIGQVSSGKSSLLNHLLDADLAETDVSPTTARMITYLTELDGTPCTFIDSPGIDATPQNRKELLTELCNCDMILWLIRADRPSRAPDLALFDEFTQWAQNNPSRRIPSPIFLLTFVDRLSKDWPFPEHEVPYDVQQLFRKVTQTVAVDFDKKKPIPVSNHSPVWNIETVVAELESHIVEALMIQRNRKRLTATRKSRSLMDNAKRGAGGAFYSAKFLGSKWLGRKRNPFSR